jgi:hypothetical protein
MFTQEPQRIRDTALRQVIVELMGGMKRSAIDYRALLFFPEVERLGVVA